MHGESSDGENTKKPYKATLFYFSFKCSYSQPSTDFALESEQQVEGLESALDGYGCL